MSKSNPELDMARYIKESVGDECGVIFVSKSIYMREDGTHEETYTINAFHGEDIVSTSYNHERLDKAAIEAIRKFREHLDAQGEQQ